MKTRVKVTLRAEQWVEIEVEHEADEDPCDLTDGDRRRAQDAVEWASSYWEIEGAEVVP